MARLTHVPRIGCRSSALALLWLASLVLLAGPGQAARDVTLRWTVPTGEPVNGYQVYLALQPGAYQPPIDVGYRTPDSSGVATAVVQLGSDVDYYAAMTAYNSAGESALSNEIVLDAPAPPTCSASNCDDGNICTFDTCLTSGCTHAALTGGTCDDGDPSTVLDTCSAGVCQGTVSGSGGCTSDSECDDLDGCNGAERCISNSCVTGTPLFCPAPTQCTVGVCQSGACGSTPVLNGLACNDGNSSTTNDACQAGICVGQQSPPPDPTPDPIPPVAGPDVRPLILEALGAMAVASVIGEPSVSAQVAVIPPTAVAVPTDPGLKVFNPAASVSLCESEFCVATSLETDARGRVRGSGSMDLGGGETLDTAFSGELRGYKGVTKVTHKLKLKGTVQGVEARGTSKLRGELNWSTGLFEFKISAKVCSSDLGCETMALADAVPLNPDAGLWTLHLDVVNVDGESLGGTAIATLGDGRTLTYEAQGKHSSKTDLWSLKLKGTGTGAGSSIKLKDVAMSGSKLESGTITHKILGHRGSSELLP
jgi:hypothetical protein